MKKAQAIKKLPPGYTLGDFSWRYPPGGFGGGREPSWPITGPDGIVAYANSLSQAVAFAKYVYARHLPTLWSAIPNDAKNLF